MHKKRKVFFVSFWAGRQFKKSGQRIKKEAKRTHVFNGVTIYSKRDIPYQISSSMLMLFERGFGYWIWKPWIIINELSKRKDGDIVVYADCGCKLYRNDSGWAEVMSFMDDSDALFFKHRGGSVYSWGDSLCSTWIKKSVVDFFSPGGNPSWLNDTIVPSGFIVVKKTKASVKLMMDWFEIMAFHPTLLVDTFGPEVSFQSSSFIEHRHDQAILTGLIYTQTSAKIILLPETFEPSLKHSNPIVTAYRIKSKSSHHKTLMVKIKDGAKMLLGDKRYKSLRSFILQIGK